jgi:hypothetical protein
VIGKITDKYTWCAVSRGLLPRFLPAYIILHRKDFLTVLDPRSIVGTLDFISNKDYWDHAFRSTPWETTQKGFLPILHSAARSQGQ